MAAIAPIVRGVRVIGPDTKEEGVGVCRTMSSSWSVSAVKIMYVCLYMNRHRDKFRQGLNVPGCGLMGGIHRLEHGEDLILGKPFPGKGVGRGS